MVTIQRQQKSAVILNAPKGDIDFINTPKISYLNQGRIYWIFSKSRFYAI